MVGIEAGSQPLNYAFIPFKVSPPSSTISNLVSEKTKSPILSTARPKSSGKRYPKMPCLGPLLPNRTHHSPPEGATPTMKLLMRRGFPQAVALNLEIVNSNEMDPWKFTPPNAEQTWMLRWMNIDRGRKLGVERRRRWWDW
ncbi:hypothetical protein ABW19_dt0200801 [Dactylella cylindrospora]|nr:hypothetical protein ABW19_dt0200801 [Dactylella cylindrospora]